MHNEICTSRLRIPEFILYGNDGFHLQQILFEWIRQEHKFKQNDVVWFEISVTEFHFSIVFRSTAKVNLNDSRAVDECFYKKEIRHFNSINSQNINYLKHNQEGS